MITKTALVLVAHAAAVNMNGDYVVASGARQSVPTYNTDYASKGYEFFDIYSQEVSTQYGQVGRYVFE